MHSVQSNQKTAGRVVRLPQIIELTGMSRSTIWRLSRDDPYFPKPFALAKNITVWDQAEVLSWIDAKKATRSAK